MTRKYTIHINPYNFSLLSMPNYKKIPNHASTQYAYAVYPLNPIIQKTHDGFAPRPIIQRKATKDVRPLNAVQPATHPVANPTAQKKRDKFRKDINKDALAAYFDNTNQISESAQWIADTVAELDAADMNARKNQFDLQQNIEQRYALFDIVRDFDYANATMDEADAVNITNIKIVTMPQSAIEQIKAIAEHFASQQKTKMSHSIHSRSDLHHKCADKPVAKQDFTTVDRAAPEINEFIAARFVQKYKGADTSAAMRALDKQQRNKTNTAYILHQLQITK